MNIILRYKGGFSRFKMPELEDIADHSEREERKGRSMAKVALLYAVSAVLVVSSAVGLTSCSRREQQKPPEVTQPAGEWPKGGEIVGGLLATIRSNKESYRHNEIISGDIRLRNLGDEDRMIIYDETASRSSGVVPGYLSFDFLDKQGNRIEYSPPRPMAMVDPSPKYRILEKGASLVHAFQIRLDWLHPTPVRDGLKPGEYTLTFYLRSLGKEFYNNPVVQWGAPQERKELPEDIPILPRAVKSNSVQIEVVK